MLKPLFRRRCKNFPRCASVDRLLYSHANVYSPQKCAQCCNHQLHFSEVQSFLQSPVQFYQAENCKSSLTYSESEHGFHTLRQRSLTRSGTAVETKDASNWLRLKAFTDDKDDQAIPAAASLGSLSHTNRTLNLTLKWYCSYSQYAGLVTREEPNPVADPGVLET